LLDMIGHNLFLIPVALCGVLAWLITTERLFHLYVRAALAPTRFFQEVQKRLLAGNLDGAVAHCNSAPRAPLARVVKAALLRSKEPREDIVLAVEQATADELPALQVRVSYLAAIANIVTLFGLLGTIAGLISSFEAVAQADPQQKQEMLAKGIALAMNTTAAGIAVAIPTLAAHALLTHRIDAILDDLERYGLRIIQLVITRQRGTTAVTTPPDVAT